MTSADELKEKQKKLLLSFQECAREIKTVSPKVAYYARLFGVDEALALGTKDMNPVIKEFVTTEIQDLEKLKTELAISSATRDADAAACLAFAKMVFTKADKLDRSGLTQHIPAAGISFKRAVQFFRVSSQFGPLPEEMATLQKYAAWRSIELIKAHKEKRAPAPPPPREGPALGEDAEADLMAALDSLPSVPFSGSPSGASGTTTSTKFQPPPPPPPQQQQQQQPNIVRHFQPGQEVLYCSDATVNCSKDLGIIQSITHSPSDGELVYTVQLMKKKQTVTVEGEFLAPTILKGARMLYYPEEGGGPEEVHVEEVYASRWPPSYLVIRPGRGLVETEDERLGQVSVPSSVPSHEEKRNVGDEIAEMEAELAAETKAAEALAAAAAVAAATVHDGEDVGGGGGNRSMFHEEDVKDSPASKKSESSSVAAAALVADVVEAVSDGSDGNAYAYDTMAAPVLPSPIHPSPPPAPPAPAASLSPPPPPLQPTLSSSSSAHLGAPSTAVWPPPPPPPPLQQQQQQQPVTLPPPPAMVMPPGPSSHIIIDPNFEPPLEAVMEAQKVTKTAGSALAFEDVPTAVKYLQEALQLLTNPGAKKSSSAKKK